MATAKQRRTARSGPSPGNGPHHRRGGRPGGRLLLGAGLLAAVVVALYWYPLRQTALAGTAFGARIACSCRYVAGRALSDCREDFEPGMALVILSEDDEARAVTARIPFIASQSAAFRPGQGCVLERWDG